VFRVFSYNMSTDTATVTGSKNSPDADALIRRLGHSHVKVNRATGLQPLEPIRIKRKYRHVAAVHSKSLTSCLSHDSEIAPSFLGFRNLMVIVLSMPLCPSRVKLPPEGKNELTHVSCWQLAIDD